MTYGIRLLYLWCLAGLFNFLAVQVVNGQFLANLYAHNISTTNIGVAFWNTTPNVGDPVLEPGNTYFFQVGESFADAVYCVTYCPGGVNITNGPVDVNTFPGLESYTFECGGSCPGFELLCNFSMRICNYDSVSRKYAIAHLGSPMNGGLWIAPGSCGDFNLQVSCPTTNDYSVVRLDIYNNGDGPITNVVTTTNQWVYTPVTNSNNTNLFIPQTPTDSYYMPTNALTNGPIQFSGTNTSELLAQGFAALFDAISKGNIILGNIHGDLLELIAIQKGASNYLGMIDAKMLASTNLLANITNRLATGNFTTAGISNILTAQTNINVGMSNRLADLVTTERGNSNLLTAVTNLLSRLPTNSPTLTNVLSITNSFDTNLLQQIADATKGANTNSFPFGEMFRTNASKVALVLTTANYLISAISDSEGFITNRGAAEAAPAMAKFSAMEAALPVVSDASLGSGGGWTVNASVGGYSYLFDMNLTESLVALASKIRSILRWFAFLLFAFAVVSEATEYMRTVAQARTMQMANVDVAGFNVGAGVTLAVAFVVVICVVMIPGFLLTTMDTPLSEIAGGNPFLGGNSVFEKSLGLADAFIPIGLIVKLLIGYLAFKLAVGKLFLLATAILRWCVGN